MFKTVLVANRGEIAVRIIRACKMLNIKTIAIFSTADSLSQHVKIADEAYCLGSGTVQDTYLNIDKIISIAKKTKANAIHPGYGFLSENAEFAERVISENIFFIGPSPSIIRLLGDKVKARAVASKVGLPIVPGSKTYVNSVAEAESVADEIGYPIIIKAAFGGGGRGMEIVRSKESLEVALLGAQSIAENFFGAKEVFIEKYIEDPKHIEIQFIADNFGNVIHLGDRECSIQRSHQKVIEEAPSFLSEEERAVLGEKVCKLVKDLHYSNVGTAEFLWKDGKYYFNEINPRIQVEHPVTEMVTGIDLVSEQLKVASGAKLSYSQENIKINGNAIEFRINAEDPYSFLPQSGKIEQFVAPTLYHVRFDTFIYPNYNVTNHYDSLLGKLIVWGKSRQEAIERSKLALNELILTGITTNISLHKAIIETKEFRERTFSTSFLENMKVKEKVKQLEEMEVAAIFVARQKQNISSSFVATPNKRKQKANTNLKSRWRLHSKLEQSRYI